MDVAERRSEGQFFKNLYRPKNKAPRRGKITARSAAGAAAAGAAAAPPELDLYGRPVGRGGRASPRRAYSSPVQEKHGEAARSELAKPGRAGLYAYLSSVLLGVCGYELLLAEAPSAPHLALYGVLGVCLGGNYLAERDHLGD